MAAALKSLTALIFIISVGSRGAAGVQQHVVGGDQGWDVSSDIASWSSPRNFLVGDLIWFGYEAAQESVVELHNIEEFILCDVSNPIRILTDGLNKVHLDREGIRYFASGYIESCKNGLKLHVEVQSKDNSNIPAVGSSSNGYAMVVAAGPSPSISAHISGLSYVLLTGALVLHIVTGFH